MAAEHHDHSTADLFCRRDRVDYLKEITRDQNIWKGFEEGREASIIPGR
jgi:hypothetical protein